MKSSPIVKLNSAAIAEILKAKVNPTFSALESLEVGEGIKTPRNQMTYADKFRKAFPARTLKSHGIKNAKGKVEEIIFIRTK